MAMHRAAARRGCSVPRHHRQSGSWSPRSANWTGHNGSEGIIIRPPNRAMVARSRSGASSGLRGSQRFRAAPSPDQPGPEPPAASSPVISRSSSGPAASWPVAIRRPSTAPATCTSASPAASCGSISRDNAALAIRSPLNPPPIMPPPPMPGAGSVPGRCRYRPGCHAGPGPQASTPVEAPGHSRVP